LSFFLLSLGCRTAEKSPFTIQCSIFPNPPHVGVATVRVQVVDSTRHSVPGQISLEADMSHPGMRPVFGSTVKVTSGEYEAKLDFNMPGDWTLLVHANLANGRAVEKQVRLTVME
jgi:hypothetical protein